LTDILTELSILAEEQELAEMEFESNAISFWKNLTEDERSFAVFYVISVLTKAELDDKMAYRDVMKQFGVGDGSYGLGIQSGMMRLHQHIITPQELRLKNIHENELKNKFTIKSRCDSCGYQSMDIWPEYNRMCPMIDCEGMMK